MKEFIKKYSDFVLNETLKTNEISFVVNSIERELAILEYSFNIHQVNNTIKLTLFDLYLSRNKEYLKLMLNHLDSLFIDRNGWFPSYIKSNNLSNQEISGVYDEDWILKNYKSIKEIIITYEAKYDIEIDKPNIIYHMSIQQFEESIKNNGLMPKTKSKMSSHIDRIYVCANKDSCYNLIPKMNFYYNNLKYDKPKNKINSKWILYEIDIQNLNIKLFKDTNYYKGYYIVDNIPKENITIIDKE